MEERPKEFNRYITTNKGRICSNDGTRKYFHLKDTHESEKRDNFIGKHTTIKKSLIFVDKPGIGVT